MKKKILLVAAGAIAAMAFAAPSSFASLTWYGVSVSNASPSQTLTASASSSVLHAPGGVNVSCNVGLGTITVYDGTGTPAHNAGQTSMNSISISPGNILCLGISAESQPWSDQICAVIDDNGTPGNTADDQERVYDLIDAHINAFGTHVAGQLAAELQDSSGDPTVDPMTPGIAYLENNTIADASHTGYSIDGTYTLNNSHSISGTVNKSAGCPVTPNASSEPPSGWIS